LRLKARFGLLAWVAYLVTLAHHSLLTVELLAVTSHC